MEQYIKKSALVAEIKGYISNYKEIVAKTNRNDSTWVDSVSMIDAKIDVLQHLLSFLNTLEVKEVQEEPVSNDLEEAARKIATRHSHISGDTYYANDAWFFKKGAQWQKEQMMKDAVYGLVCGHDESSPAWIDLNLLNKPNIKVGTEVKLIIIKDE